MTSPYLNIYSASIVYAKLSLKSEIRNNNYTAQETIECRTYVCPILRSISSLCLTTTWSKLHFLSFIPISKWQLSWNPLLLSPQYIHLLMKDYWIQSSHQYLQFPFSLLQIETTVHENVLWWYNVNLMRSVGLFWCLLWSYSAFSCGNYLGFVWYGPQSEIELVLRWILKCVGSAYG